MSGRGAEPGYVRQPKTYRLVFDKHPGLVVKTKSASVNMVFEVTRLRDQATDPAAVQTMFELFASSLLSWNLTYEEDHEKAGEPIPATLESMMDEDFDFVMMIIYGWIEAVTGVSAPLEQPSTDGTLSLVESIPMEVQSPSQAS